MADNKYVFHIGNERGNAPETLRVVLKLAWHSRPALDRVKGGVAGFIKKVKEEFPEVKLVEFGDSESKLVDVTLQGEKTTKALNDNNGPDSKLARALGHELTQKFESMVRPIADAEQPK